MDAERKLRAFGTRSTPKNSSAASLPASALSLGGDFRLDDRENGGARFELRWTKPKPEGARVENSPS